MSSVIILSSSPKTFARSPTPVDSSSPLPSTHTLLTSQLSQNTPKKFKTANVQRDGFSGYSSARSLLGTKIGAENVRIKSPKNLNSGLKILSPKRFKSSATATMVGDLSRPACDIENEDPIHDEMAYYAAAAPTMVLASVRSLKRFNSAPFASSSSSVLTSKPRNGLDAARNEPRTMGMADVPFELTNSSPPNIEQDDPRQRKGEIPRARQTFSPLNIEMAVSRRTDWTPTKDTTYDLGDDLPSFNLSRSSSASLLGSFGYNGDTPVTTPASRDEIDAAPTKRRRLDLIERNVPEAASKMPPPKTTAIKKPKAPPKKNLTITNLATSNYFGKDNEDDEPTVLDQFLSTQARVLETGHDGISSEIAKIKALKKQRASKKALQKSTLVSPTSAIKALENQDALFGSASQLARDESPSLIRDTLEAIRQSESHNFSSPLRTQETGLISIESTTPRARAGVSRFTKTRGLWAAAGRDEDNALLHVDTVDIDSFDTPDLRKAFPGKDVLMQPSASRARESRPTEELSPSLRGGDSLPPHNDNFWDIDDMETPVAAFRTITLPTVQVRAFHATTRAESPRKRAPTTTFDSVEPTAEVAAAIPTKTTKTRTPKKPAFAGLTTDKLQKQIAAYGFKPMKKREQMIAVLEKCWNQKHAQVGVGVAPTAQTEPPIEEVDDSLKHGDYLSNVHGLANRPVLKEKKVPKPRKPKEPKEPKEVKPRKKRQPKAAKETDLTAPKVVRKRKSKTVLSEDQIINVDDLEPADGNILTEAAAMALADAAVARTAEKRKTPVKTKAKTEARVRMPRETTRPTTPPPPTSSPAFATPMPLIEAVPTSTTTSSHSLPIPIDAQISLAITSYKPPLPTNHQRDPTWHEKILLYDPIVLEDLAAWLNTVGFAQIGEDREASALEVRTWCEARGVCCLWRGGWRGSKGEE